MKFTVKDIIIRGGENIVGLRDHHDGYFLIVHRLQDSVSVENALYAHPGVSEVAAVGVPDQRLGELVAAVISVKPAFRGQVTESSLISLARRRLYLFLALMADFISLITR